MVGFGRQTFALRKRRAKRRLTPFRSRLPAFVVALSLIVQLFAAAPPPAFAAPAFALNSAATAESSAPGHRPTLRPGQRRQRGPSTITHPAIAAINVSFAGSRLRLWRLWTRTCRRCPVGLKAKRMRSARPIAAATFLPIPRNLIPLGRRPSQFDGHSPRALPARVRVRSDSRASFQCFFSQPGGRRALLLRNRRGSCSRRPRRPYLPRDTRDRRSRRHRRTRSAHPPVVAAELRRRRRSRCERQLVKDDLSEFGRFRRRRPDLAACSERLWLGRARHRGEYQFF